MNNTLINWLGNPKYNLNCDIKELKKRGFENSSWKHNLAPSFITKDKKFEVFFIDTDDKEMKVEGQNKKFIINRIKTNKGEEVLEHILSTNDFNEMLTTIESYSK